MATDGIINVRHDYVLLMDYIKCEIIGGTASTAVNMALVKNVKELMKWFNNNPLSIITELSDYYNSVIAFIKYLFLI